MALIIFQSINFVLATEGFRGLTLTLYYYACNRFGIRVSHSLFDLQLLVRGAVAHSLGAVDNHSGSCETSSASQSYRSLII